MSVVLRSREGEVRPLALDDWYGEATPVEVDVLRRLHGPVLDLGCGPGRLVVALAELGTPALGVDASPSVVHAASSAGAPVLQRSVFDRLPGEGRWGSVLLFDGNVGIGGDPVDLLSRVGGLLGDRGRAVVEVEPPGADTVLGEARLERPGEESDWFPWAWVGADGLDPLAREAGLHRLEWWVFGPRWFAVLGRPGR